MDVRLGMVTFLLLSLRLCDRSIFFFFLKSGFYYHFRVPFSVMLVNMPTTRNKTQGSYQLQKALVMYIDSCLVLYSVVWAHNHLTNMAQNRDGLQIWDVPD